MKAVYFESFGDSGVLQTGDLPEPVPGAGQVLIDIAYAGVNPIDWKLREGYFADYFTYEYPVICGWDVAGTVRTLGAGVTRFSPGERVFGMNMHEPVGRGSYAQATIAPEAVLSAIPDGMSMEAAAAMPLISLAAHEAIVSFGKLARGQVALIHAGAGGVGGVAIQIAKAAGAAVVTTARALNHEYVAGLGADLVIDYVSEDFGDTVRSRYPGGIDLIVDAVGGETLKRGYAVLKSGGRMASLVDMPDPAVDQEHGTVSKFIAAGPDARLTRRYAMMFADGRLTPLEIEVLPLAEASVALDRSQAGHVRGKLVLGAA